MRKQILIALGIASLTGAAIGLVQQSFKDVPSGHWAQEAVDYAVKAGLVQGYPDQTFRGNRTLTRYELAMILFRLQKSGAMQQMPAEGQATVQAGMEDVGAEIEQIKSQLSEAQDLAGAQEARLSDLESKVESAAPASGGADTARLDALEAQVKALADQPAPAPAGNTDQEQRIAALEAQVKTLSAQPAPTPASGGADTARVEALEAQLKALTDKVNAAPAAAASGADAARVEALEAQVKALTDKVNAAPAAAPAAAGADPTPRIVALEDQVKALSTKLDGAAAGGQDARVAPLQDRVKKVEDELSTLKGEVGELKTAAQKPSTPEPTATTPTVTTPDTGTQGATPSGNRPNLYVGAGASFPVVPSGNGVNITGQVGLRRALFGLGTRIAFDLNLSNQTLGIGPDLILELNPDGFLNPYLGVGGGGVFGVANSLYVGAVGGLNFSFSPNFGVFVEANPRFSPLASANQFGVNLRAGLKLSF